MEKLYPLENMPDSVDPVAIVKSMTRNVSLMTKNVLILEAEIDGLREENIELRRRLAKALAAEFEATGESAGFSE